MGRAGEELGDERQEERSKWASVREPGGPGEGRAHGGKEKSGTWTATSEIWIILPQHKPDKSSHPTKRDLPESTTQLAG